MNWNRIWIFIQVLQLIYVTSHPIHEAETTHSDQLPYSPTESSSSNENIKNQNDEKVISVRITSSVAVARGNNKPTQRTDNEHNPLPKSVKKDISVNMTALENVEIDDQFSDLPPNLRGANLEFLKQLHAKTEPNQFSTEKHFEISALRYDDDTITESNNQQTNYGDKITSKILSSDDFKAFRSKSLSILDDALKLADERSHPNNTEDVSESRPATENAYLSTFYEEGEYDMEDKSTFDLSDKKESKDINDSQAESSIKSVLEIEKPSEDYEHVPLARSLSLHSPSSKNYIQDSRRKPLERESSTRLTTISFNIVHDAPKAPGFNDQPYASPHYQDPKFYDTPTIYSQPSQIYSEPAKVYSEPAKVYSEPAKIYSEPSKVYSEPAKVYSEPAKFYSEPASLHLKPNTKHSPPPAWQPPPSTTDHSSTAPTPEPAAEKNYEVDEKDSVHTNGRSHGVQESTTEKCKQDSCKVGYVVKGRQFNKYRVEERTSDGFIVGEYGVVRNEDGALRGVRYTADGEASPRLIYDALMKFLQLK